MGLSINSAETESGWDRIVPFFTVRDRPGAEGQGLPTDRSGYGAEELDLATI